MSKHYRRPVPYASPSSVDDVAVLDLTTWLVNTEERTYASKEAWADSVLRGTAAALNALESWMATKRIEENQTSNAVH